MRSGLYERLRESTSYFIMLLSWIFGRFPDCVVGVELPDVRSFVSESMVVELDLERVCSGRGDSRGLFSTPGVEGTDVSRRRWANGQVEFDAGRGRAYSPVIW